MAERPDPQAVARLAMQVPALKRAPRMGWLMRGVAPGEVESVAAHTAGVGLVALLLADLVASLFDQLQQQYSHNDFGDNQ